MKVAVLNCEDSDIWEVTFSQMFSRLLCSENDCCDVYNVAQGDKLPEDITSYDGYVLTGSHYNIRDMKDWYNDVVHLIQSIAYSYSHIKVYGSCFGCQMIAYALGGQVDRNPKQNFILKAENIILEDSFCDIFNTADKRGNLTLIESHGDQVHLLPPGAIRLGSSQSCENEIYICGSKNNILACQGHPEFELDYAVRTKIWPIVLPRLSPEEIEMAETSFQSFTLDDSLYFMNVIKNFLKSNGSTNEPISSTL